MTLYSKTQLVLGMIIDDIRGEDRPSTTLDAYRLASKMVIRYEAQYKTELGAKRWQDVTEEARRYAVLLTGGKKPKMKVLYLVHQDSDGEGGVFAYFPDEVADMAGNRTSYSHIGQHSACSPDYALESRPAMAEEREELHRELSAIYSDYVLEVAN